MQKSDRCALYLRSSKDRHDVSIDAQRRQNTELATARNLTVAAEFVDAVERADDWHRPGFASLLREIEHGRPEWSTLVVLDGSRLARDDEYLAAYFRHQCRKRGIRILFCKFPPVNPMHDVMIQSVDSLFARIHSMISREKGLAGMAENVRQGWRAGGRPPYGYQLEAVQTGAVRDGAPVTKSRLVPDAEAPAIAAYLKRRAAGHPARQAAREAGVRLGMSSLVDVEWRALTYAGHTVWNQISARGAGSGGYEGGAKRRPRDEWHVRKNTHPALITEEEAEAVLERRAAGRSRYMRGAEYLLSGILIDPAGRRWHGDQGFYRCGRRRLTAAKLERQVLDQLGRELASDGIVRQFTALARMAAKPSGRRDVELKALQRQAAELERKIARVRNLLPAMRHPEALLPKLEELQEEKKSIDVRAGELVAIASDKKVLVMITDDDSRAVLAHLADNLAGLERGALKARLRAMLEKIVIDPASLQCRICYSLPAATGVMVASPRRAGDKPAIRIVRELRLYGFRRAA